MTRNLPLSPDRIGADIAALAAITEAGRPYTRRAFTPKFDEGRAFLTQAFRAAGLETTIDAAGNLIGRRPGKKPGAGTIMIGSHSDTVPDGGRFDGIAGVITGLEVARALGEAGTVLEHDLEIVDFLAEEVSIFGVSCIGSRGMTGQRPADWLTRETEGRTLADAIGAVGGDPEGTEGREDIKAFLELHIEQGPVLEAEKTDIGIVTAIAGITRIEIVLEGRADHAGTTPMGARIDALGAAARLVLAIEAEAIELASGDAHFAATVGEFEMAPNAANVVPARVRLLVDARAELREDMETFLAELEALASLVAADTGVSVLSHRVISDSPAEPMDNRIMDALSQGCDSVGASFRRMASGAGHDAAFLAHVAPAGMVFVPCREGRSHTPEEWAETGDIALGAAVMLEAVKRLDQQLQE
jgi:beta-ureidopropionase / N-carbamoyl-L-amino-acid hydrolase